MSQKKFKVKMSENFNGETGSVFTISYLHLKNLLEKANHFNVEGFTVTENGVDVFINRALSVTEPIKLPNKLS